MKLLDYSLILPEENIALDEALFLECESKGVNEGVLRFWESPAYFVVMGLANRALFEVNIDACKQAGVPIIRRTSGGGAVVQGPGCLNYAVVLPVKTDPMLSGIHSTNDFVLGKIGSALSEETGTLITIQGVSDMTVGDRKFSGNAQRRRKQWVLYHGTLLLNFDLALISQLLTMPSRQPDYRRHRSHADFLTNLSISNERAKRAIASAWNATESWKQVPVQQVRDLADKQFAREDWNFRL